MTNDHILAHSQKKNKSSSFIRMIVNLQKKTDTVLIVT